MEVRVLGPLEVVADDGAVVALGARQRRLLAALIVGAGEICSPDSLIEAVWGQLPPASARKVLQVYVSRLRRALPDGVRIRTEESGYALEVNREWLDAAVFEQVLDEARASAIEGNAALAVSLLDRADSLWRGNAFGELAYEDFARAEAERLEELRLLALEERLEAGLRLGRHARLLPQLRSLSAVYPLRERLCALLMVALYRCGRQTEALEAFASMRSRLREQLGLEPGVELRQMQRRILEHDPELAAAVSAEAEVMSALPSPPNRLLGRARELSDLRNLLLRHDVRLLVLTGAGGSGKTRLALEAARKTAPSFANGTAFADLAQLRDPALLIGTIARSVGIQDVSGQNPAETLAEALRTRELLLVVDNAEHLREAAPSFVQLLAGAPRVTLLVTSRVVLHLSGEHVYPVEPLAEEAAVGLFLERAHEAEPRFHLGPGDEQSIRRICERLDGLPLAIELAASLVRTLTPAELLARLDPRLPLLTGGPRDLPARQQTLRATLEWSYELLDEDERRDLGRLAVFAGGCTLEAAEAVCGATPERLSALVDANLLLRAPTEGGSRYSMLETIREYALERLAAVADVEALRRRHAEYFLELAQSANLSSEGRGAQRHDLVIAEQANIRVAIDWAAEAGDVALALELAVALENFWITNDPFEGVRRFQTLLDRAADVPLALRARALRALSGAAAVAGDHELAERAIRESLAAFRALGDELGVANLLHRLGMTALNLGEPARARAPLEESLEINRRLGRRKGEAADIGGLGYLARVEGDADRAVAMLEQSAAMAAQEGWTWWEANTLANLAELALARHRPEEAAAHAREALRISRRIGDRQLTVYSLAYLACVAAEEADAYRAGRLWGAVEAEEARGPLGTWEREREQYAARVLTRREPELAKGLREGRQLSLRGAVDDALADGGIA